MGINFKCGCRVSDLRWYLCDIHENMIISEVEIDDGDS